MSLEGVLPVLKPIHFTSHDVVAKVRRILGIQRIGHTGTLDPMVTGVLPLCIGRATRVVEYIQDLPKEYEAEFIIGYATDSEDVSGEIVERVQQVQVSEAQIIQVIEQFVGNIEQIPPMYSAVKVEGQRLYQLARQGITVERKPRIVMVHDIQILRLDIALPYPKVKIRVKCSKGTYIRTLCVDIGKALGYPAVMSHLIRTATGNISYNQCITMNQIEEFHANQVLQNYLIPIEEAIGHLPRLSISVEQARRAQNGQYVYIGQEECHEHIHEQDIPTAKAYRVHDDTNRFVGIFEFREKLLIPIKIFH